METRLDLGKTDQISQCFNLLEGARAMIWKLMGVAENNWRKLNAPELLKDVYAGMKFEDGKAV